MNKEYYVKQSFGGDSRQSTAAQAVRLGKAWDFDLKRDAWLSKIATAQSRKRAMRSDAIPLVYLNDLMAHGKILKISLNGISKRGRGLRDFYQGNDTFVFTTEYAKILGYVEDTHKNLELCDYVASNEGILAGQLLEVFTQSDIDRSFADGLISISERGQIRTVPKYVVGKQRLGY